MLSNLKLQKEDRQKVQRNKNQHLKGNKKKSNNKIRRSQERQKNRQSVDNDRTRGKKAKPGVIPPLLVKSSTGH